MAVEWRSKGVTSLPVRGHSKQRGGPCGPPRRCHEVSSRGGRSHWHPSPVPYFLGVESCARAAASRATGMRNGEQDT